MDVSGGKNLNYLVFVKKIKYSCYFLGVSADVATRYVQVKNPLTVLILNIKSFSLLF